MAGDDQNGSKSESEDEKKPDTEKEAAKTEHPLDADGGEADKKEDSTDQSENNDQPIPFTGVELQEINQKIEKLAASDQGVEIQRSLGWATNMMVFIRDSGDPQLLENLKIALEALESSPPKAAMANKVLLPLQFRKFRKNFLFPQGFFTRKEPAVPLVWGLIAYFIVVSVLGLFISNIDDDPVTPKISVQGFWTMAYAVIGDNCNIEPTGLCGRKLFSFFTFHEILKVGAMGSMGSIASILTRLQDSDIAKNRNPWVLFLTGLFKPFVGWFFAVFIYFATYSGFVPTIEPDSVTLNALLALGFVAGFSERFARDVMTRVKTPQ